MNGSRKPKANIYKQRDQRNPDTRSRTGGDAAGLPESPPSEPRDDKNPRWEWVAFAGIFAVIGILLFWRLGDVYLWQDEANTAVLAVRMLKYGKPLAYDGVNLLTNDNFGAENRETIGERTGNAKAGVEYIVRRGDLKADTAWIYHPWGQFLVAAGSIYLLGQTTVAARIPFALAGLATVFLLYRLARSATGDRRVALLSIAFLGMNAYWILHSRQSRYYALSSLCLLLTVLAYDH